MLRALVCVDFIETRVGVVSCLVFVAVFLIAEAEDSGVQRGCGYGVQLSRRPVVC